jgi:hypothetical protein
VHIVAIRYNHRAGLADGNAGCGIHAVVAAKATGGIEMNLYTEAMGALDRCAAAWELRGRVHR